MLTSHEMLAQGIIDKWPTILTYFINAVCCQVTHACIQAETVVLGNVILTPSCILIMIAIHALFTEIMPVLSNYVRVGGDTFLTDPKRAEMIVSMCSAVSCSHAH